ncbi:hypothetical protein [Armatimonas sp.]|uniref:hypothetical protein n=1 Tax=Armatimonas sp. TaxID=1872638 RepID=UPI003751D9F9
MSSAKPDAPNHLGRATASVRLTLPLTSSPASEPLAGKYALGYRLQPSGKLLPSGGTFETLEEANAAWHDKGDSSLFIALAVRWRRRWVLPCFNPLYVEHPNPEH